MYNHLTECKQMSSGLFKKSYMHLQITYKMYKEDLALNNLQWLICHKTQPNLKCNLYTGLHTLPKTIHQKVRMIILL